MTIKEIQNGITKARHNGRDYITDREIGAAGSLGGLFTLEAEHDDKCLSGHSFFLGNNRFWL